MWRGRPASQFEFETPALDRVMLCQFTVYPNPLRSLLQIPIYVSVALNFILEIIRLFWTTNVIDLI